MMQAAIASFRKVLGHSVQERPIEGVFFGPEQPERLDTMFIGVFHGDEGNSADLLQRFITHLQAGRFAGTPIDFQRQPILVIPALNPDGLAALTRQNANSVDLNRNYPTGNWVEEGQGTVYFSGSAAASEPETRLLIELIETYKPAKIITVHCPYKVLNFDGPSQALAEAMAAESGYPVVADIGYPTPGSFGTWAGKERNIPVVTLELPPNPDDPPDPELPAPESLDQIWQDNRASLEAAIRFQLI